MPKPEEVIDDTIIEDDIDADIDDDPSYPRATFAGDPIHEPERPDETDQANVAEAAERRIWKLLGIATDEDFDALQPEARDVLLMQYKAEHRSAKAPDDKPESEAKTGQQTTADDFPLPITPQVDVESFTARIKQATEESEMEPATAALIGDLVGLVKQLADYSTGTTRLIAGSHDALETNLTSLSRPIQLRAELPKVTIATEDDIAEAGRLMETGEAKSARNALIMAAGSRLNRDGLPKAQAAPSAEAARRARALLASGSRTGTRRHERRNAFTAAEIDAGLANKAIATGDY